MTPTINRFTSFSFNRFFSAKLSSSQKLATRKELQSRHLLFFQRVGRFFKNMKLKQDKKRWFVESFSIIVLVRYNFARRNPNFSQFCANYTFCAFYFSETCSESPHRGRPRLAAFWFQISENFRKLLLMNFFNFYSYF